MDIQEITRRLIQGPSAIDQMRKKIEDLISMIVGWVGTRVGPINKEFGSGACRWYFRQYRDIGSGDFVISVSYTSLTITGEYIIWTRNYTRSGKIRKERRPHSIHIEHVVEVFKNLHVFVGGMAKSFSDLPKQWRPLIEASQVFETYNGSR